MTQFLYDFASFGNSESVLIPHREGMTKSPVDVAFFGLDKMRFKV